MRGDRRILDVGDDRAALVGNVVEIVPPSPNTIKRTPILQVGSKDVGSAEMITVTLFVEPPEDVSYPTFEDLKAWVEWGAGTATHSAAVDFLRGTMLSVNATFLKILALHEVGPDPGRRWRVGASLAYGSRPSHYAAPTTTLRPREVPLAPSGEITVPVVPFAIATDVLFSPASATAELDAIDLAGARLYTERLAGAAPHLPVVGGQHAFTLRNTGRAAIESVVFRQILAL